MSSRKATLLSVLVIISLASVPLIGAAEVTLETDTSYAGGAENQDQSVEVTVTLSPDGSKMTDAQIQISGTDRTFVDFTSFTKTVNPADSAVTVQSTDSQGEFQISTLAPDETVTITFEVFPREIKQTSLDVANVDLSYIQNGQELSASTTATADLSTSPWFKFQNAKGGGGNALLLGIAVVVGVLIGAAIAFVAARRVGGGGGGAGDGDGGDRLGAFEDN